MSKNNNSIAKQALLDMESIKAAIKEESKNTLKTLMAEAVKDSLREAAKEGEEDGDAEEYEVQGEEQDANAPVDGEQPQAEQPAEPEAEAQPEAGAEEAPAEEEQPAEGDEWSEFEGYKVGDDTYDLTGVEDPEQVVKVYKLLKNDDQVVVRKDGDKVSIKDPETDAEYVIDLGGEEEPEQVEGEESPVEPEDAQLNEEWHEDADYEFEHDDEKKLDLADDMEDFDEDEEDAPSVEDEDEYWDKKFDEKKEDDTNFDFPVGAEDQSGIAGLDENKKNSRKTMKEGKKQEVIFEVDLGYTDNYQKEDPIAGLSSQEPSKKGRSVDKGIPTGTEKPWAGKKSAKDSQPFDVVAEEDIPEVEPEVETEEPEMDENVTVAKAQKRHMVKTMAPNSGEPEKPEVTKVTSVAGQQLAEIKAENKELKEAVLALKKSLNESLVTNVNLGKVTKLFVENTTSQAEKVEIINRFCNEAKTIEQSKALYETISRELKKNNVTTQVVKESVAAAKPVMNEAKTKKSSDLMDTIDLMNRVMNL